MDTTRANQTSAPGLATPRRQRPGSARRRLRLYTRGIPILLSAAAIMTLSATPAGEFLGPESAEAARTANSANPSGSAPTAECQVKGSTYVDENANGRFDADENGLSGAVLTLRARNNWFQAAADRNGRFSIAGLPAGALVITIDSPRAAERFGPARRTVTVGTKCVALEAIALVPEQTEFTSFG
jgi:hypothetical protein